MPAPRIENKKLVFRRRYNLVPHLPISRREMTEVWRSLRRLQRSGIPQDLDVEATISDISKCGFFSRPVFKPRRRNQVKLVLLIDQEGSMSPFQLLIKVLIESIQKGGLLSSTTIYYFHNCPEIYLFTKPNLTNPIPAEEILSEKAQNNSVLIVSDAGAARRTYNRTRLKNTQSFLKLLMEYTYLYAWLNPVPKTQWRATTSEDIAKIVPMYPVEREGLNDAVKILLGHPFPPEIHLNYENY